MELKEKTNEIIEKDEKKNSDFVQLYRNHITEVRWLLKKNPLACEIFLFLLEHMDTSNALACSSALLEDYFEKSRTTIFRAIKVLKEEGFVHTLKLGTSNVYIVNQDIAWSSWNNKKEYCKFEGKILVSRKENKDYAYKKNFEKPKVLSNPNLKKEGEF